MLVHSLKNANELDTVIFKGHKVRMLVWEKRGMNTAMFLKRFGYRYELLSLKIVTCPHKVFGWHKKKVLRNSHLFFPSSTTVYSSPSESYGLLHFFLPTQASHWQLGLPKPPLANLTELIIDQLIQGSQCWSQETMISSLLENTTFTYQARPVDKRRNKASPLIGINKFGTQLKLALHALRGRD